MQKYVCPCGYVYDPAVGDPDNGIAPVNSPWEQVPEDWVCPTCGLGKDVFEKGSMRQGGTTGPASLLSTGVRSAGWLPFAGMFRHALQRAGLAEMLVGAAQSACGTIRPDNSAVHPQRYRWALSQRLRAIKAFFFCPADQLAISFSNCTRGKSNLRKMASSSVSSAFRSGQSHAGFLGRLLVSGEHRRWRGPEMRERAVPEISWPINSFSRVLFPQPLPPVRPHGLRLQSKGQGAAHWPSAIVGERPPAGPTVGLWRSRAAA